MQPAAGQCGTKTKGGCCWCKRSAAGRTQASNIISGKAGCHAAIPTGACGDPAGVAERLLDLTDNVMGVADFQAKIDSGQIGTSQDTRSGSEHVTAAHHAVTENAHELVKSIKA